MAPERDHSAAAQHEADAALVLASLHSSPTTTARSLSPVASDVCKLQYPPISRAESFANWTAGLFPPSFDTAAWYNTPSEAFYPGAPQPAPLSFDLCPSAGEMSDMDDVTPAPRRRRRYRSHIYTEQQRRRKPRKRSSQLVSDSPSDVELSDDPTTPSPGRADDRSYSMPYRLIGDGVRPPQTRVRPSPRRRDEAVLPTVPGSAVEGGGSPSVSPTWKQKRRLPATQPVLIDSLGASSFARLPLNSQTPSAPRARASPPCSGGSSSARSSSPRRRSSSRSIRVRRRPRAID